MVHFVEGVDPGLVEFLHNPPYIPMTTVPHAPATANTPEIPEYQHPKPIVEWIEQESDRHELSKRAKRLLIMAISNDIFQSLDSCETSEDLWLEALSGESIQSTYNRYNSLINKCKRYGINRTPEENNVRFLQSLNDEWLHLTMSMQETLYLDVLSISDLFGTLISQENRISKFMAPVGGPLALVGNTTEVQDKGKKENTTKDVQKKKKKKVFVAESDSEESSEEEMDMAAIEKTLALMTPEYNKGLKKKLAYRGRSDRDDRGRGYGEPRKFGKQEHDEPRQEDRRD
ncbi:hypothetical protein L6452_06569 [Arctium lappa]|uniref:Uncharacterized protein n=1 Tax=Arctium lappa TaxID=4217 RepID=A0ACB9EKL3_ARCLA|nr:hypothetical protein L6452_06569 [Arctium lappa]